MFCRLSPEGILNQGMFSFGVVLGSFWDRFGIVSGSFWDRFRIVLGSFWNCVGIVLGSFWDLLGSFGVVLGSFWDRFGIVSKAFWDRFGVEMPKRKKVDFRALHPGLRTSLFEGFSENMLAREHGQTLPLEPVQRRRYT